MKLCNEVEYSNRHFSEREDTVPSNLHLLTASQISLIMHDPANDYYRSSYHTRDNVNSHLTPGGYGITTNRLTAREGYGIA